VKNVAGAPHVVVYGASGHGKVVADILRVSGVEVRGFVDDNTSKTGEILGLKILGDWQWLRKQAADQEVAVALGIGDNFARRIVMNRCITAGVRLLTVTHPTATIAASVKLSEGAVVMPQVVINADAVIGRGAIINTGAVVEHDCRVGDFAHLSPMAAIGGRVQIGNCTWLGIGSAVIHNINIGAGSIVGAGATVVRDIGDWVVAIGTPARVSREIESRPDNSLPNFEEC
jgi:sugar O-acyltransferase (sialic acid O-acetyltransferase NeuD family)